MHKTHILHRFLLFTIFFVLSFAPFIWLLFVGSLTLDWVIHSPVSPSAETFVSHTIKLLTMLLSGWVSSIALAAWCWTIGAKVKEKIEESTP